MKTTIKRQSTSSDITQSVQAVLTFLRKQRQVVSEFLLQVDQSQALTLYSLSSSHPLCKWIIQTDSSYKLTINITRSSKNNDENIVIELSTVTNGKGSTSTTKVYNNEISSCKSEKVTLTVYNAASVTVIAKILNAASNYTVVVSQVTQKVSISSNYETDQKVILASCIVVIGSFG